MDKGQVWIIGDTTHDILGAKNYGAKSIGACWNKAVKPEQLKLAGADFLSHTPKECLTWLIL